MVTDESAYSARAETRIRQGLLQFGYGILDNPGFIFIYGTSPHF
jgi:hypothetical protein